MKKTFFAIFLSMTLFAVYAQTDSGSNYDQHKAFDPFFYPNNGNQFRSAGGQPGPDYWQNSVDYKIVVDLDTASKEVKGDVTINYKNNSPDALSFLWLQLE